MAQPKPTRMPAMANTGKPRLPSASGCGPRNHPAVAEARRMASRTSVAVIEPLTVITPAFQPLIGPSSIGGTYVPLLPAPGAGHTVVERCAMSGAPQPACDASFIALLL